MYDISYIVVVAVSTGLFARNEISDMRYSPASMDGLRMVYVPPASTL
jgi:hypothetical protein